MSIIGYDPYGPTTAGPVAGEDSISIKNIPQGRLVKTVELSKEAIDQIAEAVAEKVAAKMEPQKAPERKTGNWLIYADHLWKCSVCADISCCTGKFCNNCGAEMLGEEIDVKHRRV